jgi:hypothetical protein
VPSIVFRIRADNTGYFHHVQEIIGLPIFFDAPASRSACPVALMARQRSSTCTPRPARSPRISPISAGSSIVSRTKRKRVIDHAFEAEEHGERAAERE